MPMQALPALPDVEPSKSERVYNDLRRRIRELTLPPGAPLRKEEIALASGVLTWRKFRHSRANADPSRPYEACR
jgi:hypothetical protein